LEKIRPVLYGVGTSEAIAKFLLEKEGIEIVGTIDKRLDTLGFFNAIGQFYEDFRQVSDEEVIQLLDKA
jgi:predicted phosphoribosyltransferase